MSTDDEEDWVGTPPEGRISGDRARPRYWASHIPPAAGLGVLLVIVVLVVVLLARA